MWLTTEIVIGRRDSVVVRRDVALGEIGTELRGPFGPLLDFCSFLVPKIPGPSAPLGEPTPDERLTPHGNLEDSHFLHTRARVVDVYNPRRRDGGLPGCDAGQVAFEVTSFPR
jgi:hypothetical protein